MAPIPTSWRPLVLATCLLAAVNSPRSAPANEPAVPDPVPLTVFSHEHVRLGGQHGEAGHLEVVPLQDLGSAAAGEQALRIQTRRPLGNFWKLELSARTRRPIQKNQPILVRFFARAISPIHKHAPPQTTVYFQRSGEPWDKSLAVNLKPPAKWKRYEIPFRVHDEFATGEAMLCFGFGFEPQTVELTGVECLAYPASTAIESLPRSR